jgi:hypothetical protein
MKARLLLTLLFLQVLVRSNANDGAFRAAGNLLIPMYETDVAAKKEILSIRRINPQQAQIEVYYEFFNPGGAKTLEVGFEAYSPSGDADKTPQDGRQPYITRFTVNINGEAIPYKVAIVHDSIYYRAGQFRSIPLAKAIKESQEEDYVDFFYVYHFKCTFKPGLNIIRHTYIVDLSNSVIENYSLNYVLTAAKRWANRQIDDFTLRIDMGEFQDISIQNTFFKDVSEWHIDSTIKAFQLKGDRKNEEHDTSEFFIRKGMIVFSKKDFKPIDELRIQAFSNYFYRSHDEDDGTGSKKPDLFNSNKDRLPFSIEFQDGIFPPADELSRKILRNLPYARRGYIFKSADIASYYNRQKWYLPDLAYKPVAGELTKKEQEWLQKLPAN